MLGSPQFLLMPGEPCQVILSDYGTVNFRINWSISESDTQVNPTTCLGDTDCWIQQVTAPTLVVTCWIQQSVCISPSTCREGEATRVRLECKMHTDCWIQ